jgi:ATP-dependent protease ClpP protease subunit
MEKRSKDVTTHYESDRAVIRFSGDVSADRIFNLCDEIDFAISDYFYKRILIRIDSPGGEAKSLLYFVHCLKKWRDLGILIETEALTSCCSAAAYMLSLGDLGHRSAMPDSMLLYHNARISAANTALTDESLDGLQWGLKATDGQLITHLLRHLHGDKLPGRMFNILNELVCCLPDPKRDIDGKILEPACDTRDRKLLQKITACTDVEERLRMRRELYRSITDKLRGSINTRKPRPNKVFCRCADEIPGESNDRNMLAWLYNRYEQYKQEFARDEYMRPERAIESGLIDRIERIDK